MIPKDLQFTYKKVMGFTEQQHQAFIKLESYNVNVNQFLRTAFKEKLQRDWPGIKEQHDKIKLPF